VFYWENTYWLIDDYVSGDGLRIYKSSNGISQWGYITTILSGTDGVRPPDDNVGHHPDILLQEAADGSEQCLLFYFTHQGNQTVIQLAEIEMGSNGVPYCDRNKYAY